MKETQMSEMRPGDLGQLHLDRLQFLDIPDGRAVAGDTDEESWVRGRWPGAEGATEERGEQSPGPPSGPPAEAPTRAPPWRQFLTKAKETKW